MRSRNKNIIFHLIKIASVFVVAGMGSLPFLLWPEAIKEMAVAGYIGLLAACFLTNATVFLPASGIAFTVTASMVLDPLNCTIIGGIGTACGELVGFYCGRLGKNAVDRGNLLYRIQKYVDKFGVLTVWLFAFSPFPMFDLVGIAAGAAKMPFLKFIIPCIVGKTMKMMVYVFLVQNYLNI